jgi:hypothetical protein
MLTKHCHNCGWVWEISGLPGRNDSCHKCGFDLKVCLNCVSYDARVAHQCKDRRADPVAEKHMANFCEYFDMAKREYLSKEGGNPRESAARDALKKLFGD